MNTLNDYVDSITSTEAPARPAPRPIRAGITGIGGMFAEPDQPAHSGRREPVQLNLERVFYITEGPNAGGIRHDWSRWEYVTDTNGDPCAVRLIWTADHAIELRGKDAFNFLRLVQDRNSVLFGKRTVQA